MSFEKASVILDELLLILDEAKHSEVLILDEGKHYEDTSSSIDMSDRSFLSVDYWAECTSQLFKSFNVCDTPFLIPYICVFLNFMHDVL